LSGFTAKYFEILKAYFGEDFKIASKMKFRRNEYVKHLSKIYTENMIHTKLLALTSELLELDWVSQAEDILHVMKLLGHKNIKNTLIYTQLVTFENDDYMCKAATTVKEATELIELGYEYVCDIDKVKLFRKPK
jgi:hypothetical protein